MSEALDYLGGPLLMVAVLTEVADEATPVYDSCVDDDVPGARRWHFTRGPASDPIEWVQRDEDGKSQRRPCPRCGRNMAVRRDGRPVAHRNKPKGGTWCVGGGRMLTGAAVPRI